MSRHRYENREGGVNIVFTRGAEPLETAWSVLKAFPGHSVFRRYSSEDKYGQNEMYGEPSPSSRSISHYRHGTLHPALQPHPNKGYHKEFGSPALGQYRQNLRISPDLDPDPHDTVLRNLQRAEARQLELPENERGDIPYQEVYGGLSPEQVMAYIRQRAGGRILAVPTMDNDYEKPLTMTNMQLNVRPHYTVPTGRDESHMEPTNTQTLSLFRTAEGNHVPANALHHYPTQYREAPTLPDGFKGPTLTEEQMTDLRRQAAQSPFNQYLNA